jgi:hypothetical protein
MREENLGDALGVHILFGRRLREVIKDIHEVTERDGYMLHPVTLLPELSSCKKVRLSPKSVSYRWGKEWWGG